MGKIYLIGGGPGSPELITLKAVEVLKRCTAILYDRLSGTEILRYVNPEAEIYYCGKEPGCHYKTQQEINDSLVKLAKQGHTVGRIKGGDPYVFGRGGEEGLALAEEGISFEVIPGITSPIAALNYGGIPVTHRGMSKSFHVFTARSAKGVSLDFDTLAKLKGTLIFMMGFEELKNITEGLMNAGMSAETPAGIVMSGTTAKQQKVTGTLENITEKAQNEGISNPCIIVVGEVVTLSDKLDWHSKLPLSGRNICITRSREQSKELNKAICSLGGNVTEIHSIDFEKTPEELAKVKDSIEDYDYVVMTSINGVENFIDALVYNHIDIRRVKGKFISIGRATTKALNKYGIQAHMESSVNTGEGLSIELGKLLKAGDKVLLPRSKKGHGLIVENLKKQGADVDDIPVYDTVIGKNHNIESFKDCDTVVFTSPSTVKNMIEIVGLEEVRRKKIISIGPVTTKALKEYGLNSQECDKTGIDGIIQKLSD